MPIAIQNIINAFARDMRQVFGDKLVRIIVYGSYARGDYTKDSDVDVMILVNVSRDQIPQYLDVVSDYAFEYLMKYGVDISPAVSNEEHFEYWVDNLPYYRNVRDEGVVVDVR